MVSAELEAQTPEAVIEITTENYITLAKHIEKLEVRASCDNPD